jgi:O-antigen ligase
MHNSSELFLPGGDRPPLPPRPRPPARHPSSAAVTAPGMVPLLPWKGVRWSVSYAALLLYVVVIVTYAVPFGQAVMIIALLGLVMEGSVRFPLFLGLFGAFVLLAFMSHFSSAWPAVVREEALEFGKVWLIALVAVSVLRDKRRVRLFMLLFLAAYALYPVRGTLINYFLSGYTIFGRAVWNYIYANPNDLAALTLLQLSIAAAYYVAEPPGWLKRAALVGMVVLPLVILLTQSRGAFLGLLFFGVLALSTQRKKLRIVGFVAMILVAAMLVLPSTAWDRLGMVKAIGGGAETLGELDDQGSAEERYQIWETSFRIISDNPVTGVGWSAYPRANALYSPGLGARDTHSTYLNLTAELGFPGLLLFLCLIAAALARAEVVRRKLRETDPVAAQQLRLLVLGLLGFLIAGIFASYAKLTFLYLHLVLMWTLGEASLRYAASASRPRPPRRGTAVAQLGPS